MDTNHFSKWNIWAIEKPKSKLIQGGVAPDCGGGLFKGAFTCVTSFKVNGTTITDTGTACSDSWREATEATYKKHLYEGWAKDEIVSVSCSGAVE
ncbi:hypothetical protein [Haliscomenobacter sp.]|uniref:hypothetical protein n=1 Tax=Haliscomenobacter sp. TaxID=2717303 RepID=UPI0035939944